METHSGLAAPGSALAEVFRDRNNFGTFRKNFFPSLPLRLNPPENVGSAISSEKS